VSAGLPVAASNKYYGIGLVVLERVCKNGKAMLHDCILSSMQLECKQKSITVIKD